MLAIAASSLPLLGGTPSSWLLGSGPVPTSAYVSLRRAVTLPRGSDAPGDGSGVDHGDLALFTVTFDRPLFLRTAAGTGGATGAAGAAGTAGAGRDATDAGKIAEETVVPFPLSFGSPAGARLPARAASAAPGARSVDKLTTPRTERTRPLRGLGGLGDRRLYGATRLACQGGRLIFESHPPNTNSPSGRPRVWWRSGRTRRPLFLVPLSGGGVGDKDRAERDDGSGGGDVSLHVPPASHTYRALLHLTPGAQLRAVRSNMRSALSALTACRLQFLPPDEQSWGGGDGDGGGGGIEGYTYSGNGGDGDGVRITDAAGAGVVGEVVFSSSPSGDPSYVSTLVSSRPSHHSGHLQSRQHSDGRSLKRSPSNATEALAALTDLLQHVAVGGGVSGGVIGGVEDREGKEGGGGGDEGESFEPTPLTSPVWGGGHPWGEDGMMLAREAAKNVALTRAEATALLRTSFAVGVSMLHPAVAARATGFFIDVDASVWLVVKETLLIDEIVVGV